ncbi:TonB-dependent receptor [Chromatiaceae bacterium AAb-1]|nr:TonB-dependent receptor [Chromatiaceae bacterium AAb-1]
MHSSPFNRLRVNPVTIAVLILLGSTFNIQADSNDISSDSTGDTSFSIGERIVVTGSRLVDASRVLTSVDRMSGDIAQSADFDYSWQLVGQLPGVVLTEFNQGTTSGKLSFRGFNGEGEVNAVKLLIDGIPSNANDGNMPYLDMIFPLEIAAVEVIRGTTDPRYGLHNIAGNVSFITRSGGNYFDSRLTAGSFGKYEGQAALGIEGERLRQNYALGYREADGFRDHAAFNRMGVSGKWAWDATDNITIGASARHYAADAEEAGYLTGDIAYSTPKVTNVYNETDRGTRDISQFGLSLDAHISAVTKFRSQLWLNRLKDDRFVKFSAAEYQQNRYTSEVHYGALSAITFEPQINGLNRLFIEAGASIEVQDNISKRYLTVERVPLNQTRDQQFDLTVKGAYLQMMMEPLSWLRITPAWRLDRVNGDFTDLLTEVQADINDYGTISQPKLSVALLPAEQVTVFANWGRTFQIGVGSGAYLIPPRQVDLEPSVNDGWELGVKYQSDDHLEMRFTWWNQTATGEFRRKLNDPSGDFDNLGATGRKGVDLQLAWTPVEALALWGAIAWQQAVIDEPEPDKPELAGNDINHIPERLYSAGIDWDVTNALRLSGSLRAQSKYELTTANDRGRYGDFVLVNVEAHYELNNHIELSVHLKNLTDKYYEYVWWDGSQTLHSPGEGRAVSASVHIRY